MALASTVLRLRHGVTLDLDTPNLEEMRWFSFSFLCCIDFTSLFVVVIHLIFIEGK